MRIIDIHTHAFPDHLAPRAMRQLEDEASITAVLDGTLSSLRDSMTRAGISVSVVSSIATRPAQFTSIFEWSTQIASDSIVPFVSIHPDDPQAIERLRLSAKSGFRGVKLHPFYQEFTVDEDRMSYIYGVIQQLGLVLLLHAGYDIAFERKRIADPVRIVRVLDSFPGLKMIASHMGAWGDWDEACRHLIGRPIYIDTSYVFEFCDKTLIQNMLESHSPDHVLFGTDSPWAAQRGTLQELLSMGLPDDYVEKMLWRNAAGLLY